MIVRAGDPKGVTTLVVCPVTGEVLGNCFEADTDRGWLLLYVIDPEANRIRHDPSITLPDGTVILPWHIQGQHRSFKLVDRVTGEVFAEYDMENDR